MENNQKLVINHQTGERYNIFDYEQFNKAHLETGRFAL